jgi:hypothetical protein
VKKDFENIGEEIEECAFCSSIRSFELKLIKYVWRWDITIPEDWKYGDWEKVRLSPKHVPLPIIRCIKCNKPVKVIPAFIIGGTTLTLPTLVFIAFVYEFSYLVWRGIPENFCTENDKIAHSTLYKAVHGMGRLLLTNEDAQKILDKYMSFLPDTHDINGAEIPDWPKKKSLRPHTQERENAVRILLTVLLCALLTNTCFIPSFIRYIDQIHLLFMKLNKRLVKLYMVDIKTVNTS